MYVIRWRRGTASEWATDNPVLAAGEPGYETDTMRFKLGDGSTAWSSLPYASVGPVQSITGTTDTEKITSIIAALVALGLATDDTT